ncbi:MAG TPA: hypothetical protein DCE52_13970 [Rhodobacteraceae bacterium]|nr:hypothetical protein [Paracoccaceae bacterium]
MDFTLLAPTVGILASFYGWGVLLQRLLGVPLLRFYYPAFGMCMLIFVGGCLNSLGLAQYWAVLLCFLIGCAACFYDFGRIKSSGGFKLSRWSRPVIGSAMILFFLLLFVIGHHSSALNMHDDYEKYLKYPIRMLQTGTLVSGSFDVLGSEALGAQSFLQAVALIFGSFSFVNVIDAVVAQFLCLLVLLGLREQLGASWLGCWLACLLLLCVDPFYVNMSSIYTGVVVFLLLFAALLQAVDEEFSGTWRFSLLVALCYASLVVLKTSYALVVPIHFLILCIAWFSVQRSVNWHVCFRIIYIPVCAVLLAMPWFLLHGDKFYGLLQFGNVNAIKGVLSVGEATLPRWAPFSMEPLFYGHQVVMLQYTMLALFLAFSAVYFSKDLLMSKYKRIVSISISLLGSISFLLMMQFFSPKMMGYDPTLRYVFSFLVPSACFCLLLLFRSQQLIKGVSIYQLLMRGFACLLLLSFVPSLVARVEQFYLVGNTMGVPGFKSANYINFCEWQQSDLLASKVFDLQGMIPLDESVLAWTLLGHFLDYRRHQIVDVDPAGLTNPWLGFPFNSNTSEKCEFIRSEVGGYIIWQYGGSGIRSAASLEEMAGHDFPRRRAFASRTLIFTQFLQELRADSNRTELLYDDGVICLMRFR